MAVITLRKGSATGPELACTLGYIDLDALEAGTHYEIAGAETITLTGGGELKVAEVNILAPGLEYVNLDGATELLPEMRWSVGATVAYPSGTWTPAESPGTQPADWDLHWRDKYYIENTYTHDGHTVTTYNKIDYPGTWDYRIQYYANSDHAALYWTPNSGVFGVRQLYESAAGSRAGIICGGMYSNFGNQDGGSDGPLAPRLKNLGGQKVGGDTIFNAPTQAYYPYRIEYAPGGATQPNIFHGHVMLLEVNYNGTRYIAFAVIGYSAADELEKCGFWMSTDKFWISDEIEPGQAGDWGKNAGSLQPSGATNPTFVSVGVNTTFPSSLQGTQFGGTAGGLHVWALTESEYGAINDFLWSESFIQRLSHINKNAGDGILAVHGMPDGFTVGASAFMHLCGIPTACYGSYAGPRVYFKDLGTVDIPAFTGTYSDYSANIDIYLPFCGTYSLDPLKVIRSRLHLVYGFDIMTGDCIAQVEASIAYPDGVDAARHPTGKTLILTAQGNAAVSLPYAYTDGGVQSKLSALSGAITAAMGSATGNAGAMMSGMMQTFTNISGEQYSHSSATGNAGAMANLKPFVWIKYPDTVKPARYAETVGHVSGLGGTVGMPESDNIGTLESYAGLQIFEAVDVSGIPCTQEEAAEIEKLLKGGVFL